MHGRSVTAAQYVDIGQACVGCHACEAACPQNAIAMAADSTGFLYPAVDLERCTECGLCRRVCPVLTPPSRNPYPKAYACVARDDALRHSSSSGGVFGLLGWRVIEAGGAVFGVALDDSLEAVHVRADAHAGLMQLQGSKYVQSRIGSTYAQARDILEAGRMVLFSGTPCQIAGFKSFLGRDHEGLLCIDIVCHGVPSPSVWRRYVQFQEERYGVRILEARFRNKTEGWRRGQDIELEFDNGAEYRETPARDPYMLAFLQDICLRPSCYACRFKGLERPSDITLADFWGIEHVAPQMDDDKGTSLVLVHSPAGSSAIDCLGQELGSVAVSINDAIERNPPAVRSAAPHSKTAAFYRNLDSMPFDGLVRKYCRPSLLRRVRGRVGRIVRQVVPRRAS